jgi:hypothetical protein
LQVDKTVICSKISSEKSLIVTLYTNQRKVYMKKNFLLSILLLSSVGICSADDMHAESKRVVEAFKKEQKASEERLAKLIKSSDKGIGTSPHPCTAFGQGTKEAGYASRLISDVIATMAMCTADSKEDKMMAALFPLFHHIAHTETENLNDHPALKWLASNWTSFGLCIGLGWYFRTDEAQAILRKLMIAVYGQHALAIAAANLDLDQIV